MELSDGQERFIKRMRLGHLATADRVGEPHVVPVCFVYLAGCFYIPIDEKPKRTLRLKRLRNIEVNPRAALLLDEYSEDWSQLGWLLVRGRATISEVGAEHAAVLAALRAKYPQYREMALQGRPLIQVWPEKVSAWGKV